jgi:hypothetical protein|tara:strand:+ start:708 stop:1427 length:720 start_codon:yes stop_codon:yes gene_type:complete
MTQLQNFRTVKLSKKTVDLLRNFSTINKSVLIPQGKLLETISVNKNIIAMTSIQEFIPEQMAIYDLPLFLGALSLFKEPVLNFPDDKRVIIFDEETKGKTVFYYSDPEIIVTPPDFNGDLPDKELHFDLPQQDIQQLLQAAKVYGVEDLCVYGFEGEYSVCVKDKKNDTSNVFSLPLKKVTFERPSEMNDERRNFCYCFKVENLKLSDGSYHVTISKKNIAAFISLTHNDLSYYIALEP